LNISNVHRTKYLFIHNLISFSFFCVFSSRIGSVYDMIYEHIFDELEISTEPFALCQLRGACDMVLPGDASAILHYILSGDGQISISGSPPLNVSSGTLVLIPALKSHALHSFGTVIDPVPECQPAALKLSHLLSGEEAGTNSGHLIALCAHLSVGLRGAADIISLIRQPLVEDVSARSPIKPLMSSLMQEISNPGLGSRAMMRAILTQCMIELLRKRFKARDETLAWMAALRDSSIWNALRTMLDTPGDNHTVESLAASVGMSRSAFAKRFSDSYGSGPMELLRDLRMRLAGSLLRETELPVKRVAEIVGFSSRSSFSRMFERKTGQGPKAFRAYARN
jgi:AraC-like DNA-binding protein